MWYYSTVTSSLLPAPFLKQSLPLSDQIMSASISKSLEPTKPTDWEFYYCGGVASGDPDSNPDVSASDWGDGPYTGSIINTGSNAIVWYGAFQHSSEVAIARYFVASSTSSWCKWVLMS